MDAEEMWKRLDDGDLDVLLEPETSLLLLCSGDALRWQRARRVCFCKLLSAYAKILPDATLDTLVRCYSVGEDYSDYEAVYMGLPRQATFLFPVSLAVVDKFAARVTNKRIHRIRIRAAYLDRVRQALWALDGSGG